MKKIRQFYICGLIALACIIIGFAWAEQITLPTYYPSPYGVYKHFRLDPRDDIDPINDACSDKGLLYFDDSDAELYYCDGASWLTISCPLTPPLSISPAGPWKSVGIKVVNNEAIPSGSYPTPGWYELDLSPWVGVSQAAVLLKVKCASPSRSLIAKPFADPDTYGSPRSSRDTINKVYILWRKYKLLMLHTDDNGKIGLQCRNFAANWDVILVAYF